MKEQPISITALLEALTHPAYQSPLLAHNYHPLPNAASDYRIHHNLLYFPMSDGNREWQMVVPLDGVFGIDKELLRLRTEHCNQSQLFAEARYIPNALTLFNPQGTSYTLPALLQQSPLAIDDFIRHSCSTKHHKRLRLALESLALGTERLMSEGLMHGSLTRHTICFNHDNQLQLTDYPISRGTTNDMKQLGEAAILLFVAGCQTGAYRFIDTQSPSADEHFRRMRCILAAAQYYSISPLVKLVKHTQQGTSQEDIADIIKELAAEPFRAMPLLEGLLGGEDVAPHHFPSEIIENVVRVDFSSCDEVLPADEGIVRYHRGGLWGYAYSNGIRIDIQRVLLYAEEFHKGKAVVKTARGFGLMERSGRMVMNDVWESLEWHSEEGVVTASDNQGVWRIYDHLGRQLSTTPADWMGCVAEGYVVARKGNKFGYYSTKGEKVTDFMYDEAFSFYNGVALVVKGDKRYHIDTTFRRINSHEEEFIQRFRGLKD